MLHLDGQLTPAQVLLKGPIENPHRLRQLSGPQCTDQPLLGIERIIISAAAVLKLCFMRPEDTFIVRIDRILQCLLSLFK
ncbi:hypothetical protein D3C80_1449100 [compost metagenome]